MPVIPSSVWTRMTRSSWLPSAMPSFSKGCRRITASTSVILKSASQADNGDRGSASVGKTAKPDHPERSSARSGASIVDYRANCLQSRPMSGASPVFCTLDFSAPGKQYGRLELPRSNNSSGWSHLFIPVIAIKGGEGPTAVVFGGVHGDEPEGQVAALNLAREARPESVPGRLIIIPCVSPEASRAYTRLWPSGANFNRSFPGSSDGAPDQQLAD